jgi:transcriptional regulator with XRE-family HTH domain
VTKRLEPARDDAGVRLRTARLRRGMTQIALAEMACVSASFVSMVETGQRELTRVCDIVALADALRVSPLYLADGWDDHLPPGSGRPGRCRSRLAVIRSRWPGTRSSPVSSSGSPGRTAVPPGTGCADWPASPASIPWLLLDQLATLLPHPRSPRNESP